jgi:predicted PurR-regulated permease PerM
MITISIPALIILALLIVALFVRMAMLLNNGDKIIDNLVTVNKINDRIIQLQEKQIHNAERRAANYEYLYKLAENNCQACLKAHAEQAENA